MVDTAELDAIWAQDRLGHRALADAFTNLVTSFDDHRTISIEAGYGQGKTFFRERWAKHLLACGENVLEIDAVRSDHSGDPVLTFLGALLGLVPETAKTRFDKALTAGKSVLVTGGKALLKAGLREGHAELERALAPDDASVLFDIASNAGETLSKQAGAMLAAQLEAEKARAEIGDRLKELHAAITDGKTSDRIIILIDELDRCHPDYAIALLEAMKLVFKQPGFVFVLMVDSHYLENIAAHRFGKPVEGELYLDKFVDLRLRLEADESEKAAAVREIVEGLNLVTSFGTEREFGRKKAAELAAQLALASGFSMRRIKRVLLRVEMTFRIYRSEPVDCPLLVFLAFKAAAGMTTNVHGHSYPIIGNSFLRRADFVPEIFEKVQEILELDGTERTAGLSPLINSAHATYPELIDHYLVRFAEQRILDERHFIHMVRILAPTYIPDHEAMLKAVHKMQVDP